MASKAKAKTKISSQAVMEEVKSLALFGGGVIAGSLGGKLIDKALKVDTSLPGFNVKAMVRPVVLLGAGTAGSLMLKDKNMKMFSIGVGASGILSGVKVVLKKDLLNGLADFAGLGEPTRVFREPINLSIERYNPDLPLLEGRSIVNREEYSPSRNQVENVSGMEEEEYSFSEII
jgi:hypothetical protein